MISRQNPLHLSSCYCYGYRFWGALSLSRVLWKWAFSRSNMKPKSIPKQARTWIDDRGVVLLLSGSSATLHVPFMLHLFACIFLHFPFMCTHLPFTLYSCPFIFLSFSFHVPFDCNFPSFSFIVLSYSFHVHSNVHSCPLMFLSFCIHVLSSPF